MSNKGASRFMVGIVTNEMPYIIKYSQVHKDLESGTIFRILPLCTTTNGFEINQ